MKPFLWALAAMLVAFGVADARLFDRIREWRANHHHRKAARIEGRMGAGACGSASSMTVTYSTMGACGPNGCAVPAVVVPVQPKAEQIPAPKQQPSSDPFSPINQSSTITSPIITLPISRTRSEAAYTPVSFPVR